MTSPPVDLAATLERSGPERAGGARSGVLGTAIPYEAPLLTLPDGQAAKRLFELWSAQDKAMRRRQQQWKANRLRRRGVTGVVLMKRQDTDEWIVYAPPGMNKQVPVLNKADRLCRLLAATIFADPPEPEAVPATDTDADRDAAEFATRMLTDLGSTAGLDNAGTARRALDRAAVYASAFRYYWVDPRGGGWQPLPLLASPARTGSVIDLTTGQPNPAAAITAPDGTTYPPPYVIRYLKQDGTLTDDRRDPTARRAWVARVRSRILTGHHVRVLPPSAADLSEAHGILLGEWVTLDELRLRFRDKVPQDNETLKRWVAYRPEHPEDTYPGGQRQLPGKDDSAISGESLVWTVCCYYRQTDAYAQGCYAAAVAGDTLLHRQPWVHPRTGDPMDLPLDHFKQMDDEDDFYGKGLMQVLGPANEVRGSQIGGMLEHQDRFLNRKTFVPINSTYQPRSAQAMTGTHIPINPGGEPKYEEVPDYPPALEKMFALISAEMEHESGLEAPATGQNPPSVGSGLHARTIIEQVHVGLSDIQQNTMAGLERGWRIQMQLASAFYTVPQRISWVGDDGAYKERLWTGADLGSTRDVRLHPGTLSMLTPSAKAAVAQEMFNVVDPTTGEHLLDLAELRRIILGNVGGLIGLQDAPARQRIRRQIDQWTQGPPGGWMPPPPSLDPATGQPVPGTDPFLAALWAPVPADDDPASAKLRYLELTRLLHSTNYSRWPAPWRGPVDAEWARAKYAAGIQTSADAAAAQQAQLDQQQQGAADQQAMLQQGQQEEALRQQQGVAAAGQQFQQAIQAVLASVQQGDEALAHQMQQFFAAHHQELVQVLESLGQVLQPQAPVPPPPMTVNVPGQAEVEQVLAQINEAVVSLRTSNEAVGEGLARLAQAVAQMAQRPTSFAIVKDAAGKPTGIAGVGTGQPVAAPPEEVPEEPGPEEVPEEMRGVDGEGG